MLDYMKSIVEFDKRKCIIGIILGVIWFSIFAFFFDLSKGILLALCYAISGSIRFKNNKKTFVCVIFAIWIVFGLFLIFIMPQTLMSAINLSAAKLNNLLLNILVILIVYGFVFIVTANWKWSVIIGSAILVLLATANSFIYQFRGKELNFADFLSVKTALNVASHYKPAVTELMVFSWAAWICYIFTAFTFPSMTHLSKIKPRVSAAIILCIMCFTFTKTSANVRFALFNNDGTMFKGYYLNFALGIKDFKVNKPDNYSLNVIEELEKQYTNNTNRNIGADAMPNIIVIMEESYADFSVFGNLPNTNKPITPFADSLIENTIKGYAMASVYGASTANSEFEFLTGNTMMFLPKNTIPYQQYITSKTYSLPYLLDSYGYNCISTHPAREINWQRGNVYPHIGLNNNSFIENYPQKDKLRGYTSDKEMFEHVLTLLEDNDTDNPKFIFGISIQNHGGYTESNFDTNIKLEGYDKPYPQAEQYFTLLNYTDIVKQNFINALNEYPEDTIVLFFGDHFPNIEPEFYEELYGKAFDTLSEEMLKYKVPFTIWANYDIEEKYIECTSLNYLSTHLLKAAHLPLSPYNAFLSELENNIPVINALGYYSKSKNDFIEYEDAKGTEKEWLDKYNILQYNNMFDNKNKSDVLFERYLTN